MDVDRSLRPLLHMLHYRILVEIILTIFSASAVVLSAFVRSSLQRLVLLRSVAQNAWRGLRNGLKSEKIGLMMTAGTDILYIQYFGVLSVCVSVIE